MKCHRRWRSLNLQQLITFRRREVDIFTKQSSNICKIKKTLPNSVFLCFLQSTTMLNRLDESTSSMEPFCFFEQHYLNEVIVMHPKRKKITFILWGYGTSLTESSAYVCNEGLIFAGFSFSRTLEFREISFLRAKLVLRIFQTTVLQAL